MACFRRMSRNKDDKITANSYLLENIHSIHAKTMNYPCSPSTNFVVPHNHLLVLSYLIAGIKYKPHIQSSRHDHRQWKWRDQKHESNVIVNFSMVLINVKVVVLAEKTFYNILFSHFPNPQTADFSWSSLSHFNYNDHTVASNYVPISCMFGFGIIYTNSWL